MNQELLIEIGIEVLSAFLGFLFALLLANMLEKKEKSRKYRIAVKCLRDELEDIVEPLGKYIDGRQELKSRIAIPTWDTLQYAGLTPGFIDKPYFKDLVRVYSLIKQFNEEHRNLTADENITMLKIIRQAINDTLRLIPEKGD